MMNPHNYQFATPTRGVYGLSPFYSPDALVNSAVSVSAYTGPAHSTPIPYQPLYAAYNSPASSVAGEDLDVEMGAVDLVEMSDLDAASQLCHLKRPSVSHQQLEPAYRAMAQALHLPTSQRAQKLRPAHERAPTPAKALSFDEADCDMSNSYSVQLAPPARAAMRAYDANSYPRAFSNRPATVAKAVPGPVKVVSATVVHDDGDEDEQMWDDQSTVASGGSDTVASLPSPSAGFDSVARLPRVRPAPVSARSRVMNAVVLPDAKPVVAHPVVYMRRE